MCVESLTDSILEWKSESLLHSNCVLSRWDKWREEHGSIYTAAAAAAKLPQSCPTLCDLIDGSPQGSPVPGILQARTLERVAISFSNAEK